jgi:hypothetical protein
MSNDSQDARSTPQEYSTIWIPSLNLHESDRIDILGNNVWLNDRVMNAAQGLLKSRFPGVFGLFDTITVAADHLETDEKHDKPLVQVLHDARGGGHWLTVSTVNCIKGHIAVYCSVQQMPSDECLYSLTRILHWEEKAMTINVMNSCKQTKRGNCGLFAIAFAETILSGKDPCNVVYDEDCMRPHLITCFIEGVIRPFPVRMFKTSRRQIVRTQSMPLLCICRTVNVRSKPMVQCHRCKEWFHSSCLNIDDPCLADFKKPEVQFVCSTCSASTSADVYTKSQGWW